MLVDPISKVPLASPEAFDLVPADEVLKAIVGAERFDLWRLLQEVGEDSYNSTGPIGNFSHGDYEPGLRLGAMLAEHASGLALDVGCGLLEKPAYMVDACRWIGIDPTATGNPAFYGAREFPFYRALGDFLPFADQVFDAVVFSSTADHQIEPARAFREAFRVLKPGGQLFVVETARADDAAYRAWKAQPVARYNLFHAWAFTEETLPALVAEAGFEVRERFFLAGTELYVRATR